MQKKKMGSAEIRYDTKRDVWEEEEEDRVVDRMTNRKSEGIRRKRALGLSTHPKEPSD